MSPLDHLRLGFGKRLPLLLQTEVAECGLICLAMISGFHGKEHDIRYLRSQYRVSSKGSTFTQMIETSGALGLSARAYSCDVEGLRQAQLPCVLHWQGQHFVVLARVTRRFVVIHDPAFGVRRLTWAQVATHFTGALLELAPNPEFRGLDTHAPRGLNLWSLVGKVVGLRNAMTQIFFLGVGIEAVTLVTPFFMQWIADHAIVTGDRELLFALAVSFASLAIVRALLEGFRGWAVLAMSTVFNIQWMGNVFSHLVRLPVLYFERRHLGDIVSRFSVLQTIQNTLTVSFVEALVDGLMAIGSLVMMLVYSWSLALVALVASVCYFLIRLMLYGTLRQVGTEAIMHSAKQQSIFLETIHSIPTLRVSNQEDARISRWLNHVVRMKNSSLVLQRYQLVFRTANALLIGISTVVVVGMGANLVLEGKFSVGMLLAFIAYKQQFSSRMSSFVDRMYELRLLELQGALLSDIVQAKPELEVQSRLLPPLNLVGSLEARNLRFRYGDTDQPVLDGVSLWAAPGSLVAIVGATGAGKSTLLKALLGLFPMMNGQVFMGGSPVRGQGMYNYRRQIAAILQGEKLLAGTLADNITMFAPDPDFAFVERCARLALLSKDIDALPMRYFTLVGDLGTALSGGQQQKILIARALYREPKIIFMDEATNHLDVASEFEIDTSLRSFNVTRIVITHRSETIARADRVYLMQHGKLSEVTGDKSKDFAV